MSLLNDLYNELGNFLTFSSRIADKTGQHINVGEEFTLRLTINNTAARSYPWVRFTELWVRVDSATHARPRDGRNGLFVVPLQTTTVDPGDSISVDVIMVATGNMGHDFFGAIADIFNQEYVANVRLSARVDPGLLFTVNKDQRVYDEIEPT
jgi:hypothetical protein